VGIVGTVKSRGRSVGNTHNVSVGSAVCVAVSVGVNAAAVAVWWERNGHGVSVGV